MTWGGLPSITRSAKVDDGGDPRADETGKVGNERPRSHKRRTQKRGCDNMEAGIVSLHGIGPNTFIR